MPSNALVPNNPQGDADSDSLSPPLGGSSSTQRIGIISFGLEQGVLPLFTKRDDIVSSSDNETIGNCVEEPPKGVPKATEKCKATTLRRPRTRHDFKIAIICALVSEADAVEATFDERWDAESYGKSPRDDNTYSAGAIGRHYVVLALLPDMGKSYAASVATGLRSSFTNIRLALVVGICGGVPRAPGDGRESKEILLGDIIISEGIVQYDIGRQLPDRFVPKYDVQHVLGPPNDQVRGLLKRLRTFRGRQTLQNAMSAHLAELQQMCGPSACYPGETEDILFEPTYRHKHHGSEFGCDICKMCQKSTDPVCSDSLTATCAELNCEIVPRHLRHPSSSRGDSQPVVHVGLFASGDKVMRSGEERDSIAKRDKVLGFEMEGAGVWGRFPSCCLVIKGVCDYADSHKNKEWQTYAAVAAAACTKAFLEK